MYLPTITLCETMQQNIKNKIFELIQYPGEKCYNGWSLKEIKYLFLKSSLLVNLSGAAYFYIILETFYPCERPLKMCRFHLNCVGKIGNLITPQCLNRSKALFKDRKI